MGERHEVSATVQNQPLLELGKEYGVPCQEAVPVDVQIHIVRRSEVFANRVLSCDVRVYEVAQLLSLGGAQGTHRFSMLRRMEFVRHGQFSFR